MTNSSKISHSNSQKLYRHQQGMTMWSMLFVMIVLFSLAYIGMQLVPIYSTNSTIKSAMLASVENKDLRTISRKAVIGAMQNQLYIDGAYEVLDYKTDVKVGRSRNKFILEANYEREFPLVSGTFMVVRFNNVIECELNGRCDP